MKGDAEQLVEFLDGAKNRFIIPVYQRNYDWSKIQCQQLFEDLLFVIKEDRKSHFFGSIVTSHAKNGEKNDFLIIDGQQRQIFKKNIMKIIGTKLRNIQITKLASLFAII